MDATQKRDNHTPSCSVCQRRKVKCDRVYPCAACTKSGLECVFPEPGTHGKRKRRNTGHQTATQDGSTNSRPSYTDRATTTATIGSFREPANDISSPASTSSQGAGTSTARLVSEGGGYRYVNNHLWNAISTDPHASNGSPTVSPEDAKPSPGGRSGHGIYEEPTRPEDASTGRNLIFGGSGPGHPGSFQAPASQIVFLWQAFQGNVDPVMKISHAPSVQNIVLGQIGNQVLPPNEQALVYAIYMIAVVSLTNEQCGESLGESRNGLLQKYRAATEAALSAAGFITSTDIMVLQALIYYLSALRSLGEIQLVWSLLGIAIRIAGTLGLARDGTSLGLSPFDTEMRRRLWWGLVYFDGRMAELVGQDGDLMGSSFDAGAPSNLNDSDLFPTMTRLPEARRGPSDACYLQARVLSITVARSLQSITGPSGTWHRLHDASMPTAEKLEIMRRIEQRYSEEIIEPCDPTVPLQWLSINTAKTFSTKLRLISKIPIVDLDKDWEDADGFSENAFILSMDLLQIQLNLWCEPSVQPWRWHWQAHFQWYALVTLLRQTRLRRSGRGASRAWTLIRKVFDIIIPSLETGPKKSLLLEGIHSLLNAAKRQQELPDQKPLSSNSDQKLPLMTGQAVQSPAPAFTPTNGHGAHPPAFAPQSHSMPMPGMTMHQQMPPPGMFGQPFIDNFEDPVLGGLDLTAIDWVEFDRLASELSQQ
ncbi:putative transcriptional regulatory protein [Cercospora beticola]|uniref:Putative transcriptional regulatory protein n=1 Tax=Cercospora beticola TaxID=122368 RepID=A0A2G5I0T9_CERBT|nr:putative transcriptional regulatory protein [Cercospora beticola]PIA98390.1 putative transcriptional regulatory protein [Cercospora beticola]WPA98698.1 hypothetical protein RHO25_003311 [Cercospora beticola]